MKYYAVLFPLIMLFLSGCDSESGNQQENSLASPPSAFINNKAVWKGGLDECFADNSEDNCLINEIKKNGTPEALKSVQYLVKNGESGYVSKFTKQGPVGIAEIEYPFRANTNTGSLLVPSIGKPVDIDKLPDNISTENWVAFKKSHPDSSPWAPATFIKNEHTEDDGIKLVFSYSVKTCHACDTLASLYISYNFTADGKYVGYNVIEIK